MIDARQPRPLNAMIATVIRIDSKFPAMGTTIFMVESRLFLLKIH